MHSTKTWGGRLDWVLALTVALGFAIHSWGTAFNALAIVVNGSMPTIGEIPDEYHSPADEQTKLIFLADRFVIHHPLLDEKKLPLPAAAIFRQYAKYLELPTESGLYSASVGDLMRWGGAAILLFATPLLLLRIPLGLRHGKIRFERRRKNK